MRIKPKLSFFKSLRFRIMVIMIIIGIVPGFIIEGMLIGSYEDRAVELRQITVRNQCDILGNQLMREGYLQQKSEVIDGELSMISSAFSARVLVINRNGRIIEDTYDIDEGKYAFSEEVIQCFEGVNTSVYDRNNTYIELTIPLTNGNSDQIEGVMLVSTSTIEIQDTIVAKARPGAVCGDLYDLAVDIARRNGFADYFMGVGQKAKFVGHGIGLEINESPVLAPRVAQTLEPGMVFALEPKIVLPGIGPLGVENSWAVTATGLEKLTLCGEDIVEL